MERSKYVPIVQPLAPYLSAGCRAVVGAVPRALFMVSILYCSGASKASLFCKMGGRKAPKKRQKLCEKNIFQKNAKKLAYCHIVSTIKFDISESM